MTTTRNDHVWTHGRANRGHTTTRPLARGVFAWTTSLAMSAVCVVASFARAEAPTAGKEKLDKLPGAKPRNVVLILVDDHRYDAMGFMGHPFLKTPNMDRLAAGGVHFENAFVTTSLCSPSRASILTGLNVHKHHVVDNSHLMAPGCVTFAQYLQDAGYQTAFVGKWHMGGESDAPRPGWDHWVSFRGQGSYLPGRVKFNVDGKHVPQKGYITDELTDYAIDWLENRDPDRPFLLFLSHKAAHAMFVPPERYKGRYTNAKVPLPPTYADTPANYRGKPMWVRNQRNSWHGVDFPYQSTTLSLPDFYRQYCEVLLGVDDSVGRVMDFLKQEGLLDSTLVLYMGDNGFCFGEHGLIDKRQAYEPSMRIPLMAHCPDLFKPGTKVPQQVANIDVCPTILEAAGLRVPEGLDGRSFLGVAQGKPVDWRKELLYEYYWERVFPQTPTVFALRGDQYKYIHYYGLWDIDELYDVQADPNETTNLIFTAEHRPIAEQMNRRLFKTLESTGGMYVPLKDSGMTQMNLRSASGSKAA